MRKLYLYKKFSEDGVSVRNMAQHLFHKITEYKNLLLQEEDFKNSLRSAQQQRIGTLD